LFHATGKAYWKMTVMKQGVELSHLSLFLSSDMSPWKNTVCVCVTCSSL